MHAGCFTRFLNHSCAPNCRIYPCIFGEAQLEVPYLAFYTTKDIFADQELTFNYRGPDSEDDDQDLSPKAQKKKRKHRQKQRAKAREEQKKLAQEGPDAAHGKDEAVCACGAANCPGYIWRRVDPLEDDGDEDQSSSNDDGVDEIQRDNEENSDGDEYQDANDDEGDEVADEYDQLDQSDTNQVVLNMPI